MILKKAASQGSRFGYQSLVNRLLDDFLSSACAVIISIGSLCIAGVAVDIEDGLSLIGIDDVDQAVLHGLDKLGVVHFRLCLCDGNGIIVNALGDADNIELVPDGIGTAHRCGRRRSRR